MDTVVSLEVKITEETPPNATPPSLDNEIAPQLDTPL